MTYGENCFTGVYGALFLCFFSACMFAWSSLCFVCVSPLMEWKQSHASDSFICLPPQTHSHTHTVSLSKAVNVNWTCLLRSFILHLHFYPLRTVCVFAHEVSDNLFFFFLLFFALLLMWSYLFLTHWHSSCLFPLLFYYHMLIAELECIAVFQFAKREPFGLHNTVFGKLQPTLITVSLFQKGESSFFQL